MAFISKYADNRRSPKGDLSLTEFTPRTMRLNKVKLIVSILFLILIIGIFYLEVIKGNYYYSLSNKNCIRLIPLEGLRGRILDHNGEVIVDNQISYSVGIILEEFKQKPDTVVKLASLLDRSAVEINKTIKKDFISSFTPIIVARNVSKKTAIIIEENKLSLPGVIIQVTPKRRYPYYNLAGHLIGYLSKIDRFRITRLKNYGYKVRDIVGFGGVEENLEQILRSVEGGTQIQVNHRGRFDRTIGFRAPANGKDIYLNIDLKMQRIIEEAFVDKKGAAVLMEPDTGKIIALVSSPNFYPGAFLEEGNSNYINTLLSDVSSPLFNRAISGQYPLGSIFKIVSAVAALEKRKISKDKRFFCPGKMFVGAKEFNCWSTHNSQDLIEAIGHSCNVYFYRLALLIGPDTLSEYALKFGLGKPTAIDLPYEVSGNVPSPLARRIKLKNWYDGDTANFGIGQGDLLVSPIQAVRFMAAIANGGNLVRPYIVGKIADEEIRPHSVVKLGLDKEIIKTVVEGLKQVVNSETGTANIGSWGDLKIAGKTGTAQVHNKLSHGWFVGFLPYDKPKIVFCIFLENSGPSVHAVMLAHQIFSRMRQENLI